MGTLGEVRAWLRTVMLRRRVEREMHDEMCAHVEQAAERFVRRGMSPQEARRSARLEFGNMAAIQEDARDSRGGRWVDDLIADIRHARRYFAHTPLTTLVIVLTLTLGMGINTAAYSLYQGLKTRPPIGIPDDRALGVIRGMQSYPQQPQRSPALRTFSLSELNAYAKNQSFTAVAGWVSAQALVAESAAEEAAQSVRITFVTPNYFQTLGVALAAGSGFVSKKFDSNELELTAVVNYRFAIERFGSAQSAIGRVVTVNNRVLTIVGVAPVEFKGVQHNDASPMFWIPLSAFGSIISGGSSKFATDSEFFQAVARLAQGVSTSEATLRANSIARQFTRRDATGGDARNEGADVVLLRGDIGIVSKAEQRDDTLVALVLAALDLVIFLVCATTVSSLLVGAAVTRRHEIGVRLALGASRARIIRQLLTESVLLALIGGLGGLLVCVALTHAFGAQLSGIDVAPSWPTLAFTVAFAMLTAIIAGLSPSLHATRGGLSNALKQSSGGTTARTQLQRTLVAAQIALAQPLLVCLTMLSVLMVNQLSGKRGDKNIEDRLVVANFEIINAARSSNSHYSIADVKARLEGVHGVAGVAYQTEDDLTTPIAMPNDASPSETERARGIKQRTRVVTADYFAVMNIPVISGKVSPEYEQPMKVDSSNGMMMIKRDVNIAIPTIVSQAFAQTLFERRDPIGRTYCENKCEKGYPIYEIIAVVDDRAAFAHNPSEDNVRRTYTLTGNEAFAAALIIRTEGKAEPLIPTLRALSRAVAPKLPIRSIETVAAKNSREAREMQRIAGGLAGGGVITLLLGCVGVYAVVALAVGQRRREIGVRIAMGARPSQVVRLFFASGLRLTAIGLAIGLPLSAAVVRVLGTLAGFPPTNTVLISTVIAVTVVAVTAVATWVPSRRAAYVDPLIALRVE